MKPITRKNQRLLSLNLLNLSLLAVVLAGQAVAAILIKKR